MESKTSYSLFTELKILVQLAVPIIVSQLAQMGMSFTDTVMAGNHNEVSLAGVAIGSSLWVPGFLLLIGVLMAVTPLVAHAWGAGQQRDIKQTVQQAAWLALTIGVIAMILLQVSRDLFDLMVMDDNARAQAKGYVYAVSFALPAIALFQVLRSFCEGVHLTKPVMYVSLIGLLLNIPLNYIFIYGKLGLPSMGGVGCGWATTTVIWIEMVLMLILALVNSQLRSTHWAREWQPPNIQKILEILKLGIPIGVSIMIEASMFTLIALLLAKLGSVVVAGHQVAMSFISILFMVPLSLSMALTIRCGFYLGRKEAHRARFIGFLGIGVGLSIASFYSVLILGFSQNIAELYSKNEDVIQLAVNLLFLAAIFQFSDAIQVTATGILRGYKDTRFAFFIVLFSYWVVGLPLGYSLGLSDYWGKPFGAQGFWMAFIVGLSIAAILLTGRFAVISKRHSASDAPMMAGNNPAS